GPAQQRHVPVADTAGARPSKWPRRAPNPAPSEWFSARTARTAGDAAGRSGRTHIGPTGRASGSPRLAARRRGGSRRAALPAPIRDLRQSVWLETGVSPTPIGGDR